MSRIWSYSEIDFLQNQVGKMKVDSIAKQLNRSVTAVLIKMKRLDIGNTKNITGGITRSELARMLGIDSKTVEWWTYKHGLPFQTKITRHSRRFFFIEVTDFWEWAYENVNRVDFSKIELNSIVPEPEWVKEYRRKEQVLIGNYYRSWTTKEEDLLLTMIDQGKSNDFISKQLNRTFISIQRKSKRLFQAKRINK